MRPDSSRHNGAMRLAPIANSTPGKERDPGQLTGEIARVGPQPHLTLPGPLGQGFQRAPQQLGGTRTRIIVTRQQLPGQHGLDLRPRGDVRAPHTLTLMVVGNTTFLAPVHLDIGSVQVDRHRAAQPSLPRRGHPLEHPLGHAGYPGFHRAPLRTREPACQIGSGGRGQPRHRRDHLPDHISALPVQSDEKILPSTLRRSQPDEQLTGPEPTVTLLDRPHRRIQHLDHPEPITQLRDRRHARHRRQRRIRRAHPHLRPPTATTT